MCNVLIALGCFPQAVEAAEKQCINRERLQWPTCPAGEQPWIDVSGSASAVTKGQFPLRRPHTRCGLHCHAKACVSGIVGQQDETTTVAAIIRALSA
jgi:hypothetical protein